MWVSIHPVRKILLLFFAVLVAYALMFSAVFGLGHEHEYSEKNCLTCLLISVVSNCFKCILLACCFVLAALLFRMSALLLNSGLAALFISPIVLKVRFNT